ncbi:hypothetical protein [Rhodomicrobium lacus]|uniref:hypothetical protein n=1 Tax=Rhodomicrobium TaxID=1068 RepID=UPI0026E1187D|nr:hypothetical protein [Rhodomicrobium lacus]WKW51734.1 hypothetical protein QMO75_04425 [Rhodomicrobium lacus]
MKKIIYLALALFAGALTWSVAHTSAMAGAAAAGVLAVHDEAANSDVIKVHGPWGGPGWGYGPGWHRGPGWGSRPWGWGPRPWGWGGPRYYGGWGPYYGWRPPYYGPVCRWRCGPYRCWRVCW